jgi:hypothetical protein
LCVKLGNSYGTAWAAQEPADQIIDRLSVDRWTYYVNERLESDRIILAKLNQTKPLSQWLKLMQNIGLDQAKITSKDARALIKATNENDTTKVATIAQRMFKASVA